VLEESDEMFVDDPEGLVGQRVDYQLKIKTLKGLPSNYNKVYCKYRFLGDQEDFTTDTVDVGVTTNFGYGRHLTQMNVSADWVTEVAATPMAIEVWGRQGVGKVRAGVHHAWSGGVRALSFGGVCVPSLTSERSAGPPPNARFPKEITSEAIQRQT